MSDDSEEDGPEFSGIIQPPLIHQLKSILDQYPDDGQILKEIIQNAEDAEASEMKVLFDERRVNEDNGTKEKAFKKYFKGPALCVYNNAKFTEQDWQGIQMIYQSVKEFDPVKVGRFGLGFKSVFHITDYPMIISGGKLLVIDPHQKDPGKVCISMKLNRLHKCIKQMETTYCLDALNGLFGFSQETLDTGDFQGTIFRFPLRSSTSALSDNIYDAEKISDLFTAFESEASVELLFLKRLEKIELFRKSQGSDFAQPADSVFSVEIADECLDDVRQKRSEFHNYMRQVLLSVTDETFTRTFNLTIVTETAEGESNKQDWLVIHCRKGRPLSGDLINLSQDESLSYSPYVSVAVPMVCDPEFIGHVFCLMPLPLENKSLTGYPVHVNGLFALDQNRRHVKWPSADQTKNKSHTDKPTRWNKCLVVEVLAYVYLMTLKELLRTCETSQFKQEDVDRVYRAIPDLRIITSNWDLIVEPLFRSLVEIPFLFTSTNGDKWILPSQAVFSIFDGTNDSELEKSVLKLAKECGIDLVEAPEHIIYILKDRGIVVKTLSRDYIVNCLRSNPCYKSLSFDDKINILLYLVNDANFGCLNGLELLPLENGTFCSFGGTNKTYICHDKADLFPGQEASFLKQGINECVYTPLYKMAKQGIFQLCTLEDQPADVIASLLQRTLQLSIGDLTNTTVFWNQTGAVNNGWLKKVWIFMQRFSLSSFEHLQLIPDNRKNELCKPSKKFLLRCGQDHSISENISRCLEYFGIAVLEDIPDEIEQHRDTRKYILSPSPENVIFMLGNVHGNDPVQKFNSSATNQERDEFLAFLSKFNNFNSGVKDLIKDIALYTGAKSGRYVCTREVNRRVQMGSIPLQYFEESLSCPTADHERLASLVNVPVIHEEDVIIDILSSLTREYSTADINRMMDYVLRNHSRFYKKDAILNKARSIEFVRSVGGHLRRADELYDPEDDMAQSIIVDKSRFPDTSNLPVEVSLLRFIGLKSWNDIQAEDAMRCAKYIENNPKDITSKSRSKAVIKLLAMRSSLLQCYVNSNMLSNLLKNICFVEPCKRVENYPECLPWASDNQLKVFWKPSELLEAKFANLIGSVKPIIHESMTDLSGHFGCNQEPQPSDVICQLLKIADFYDDRYKPDVLPMISSIYKFFSNKDMQLCSSLSGHKWLWSGNGFETADTVYINAKENDINIVPYMHPLPKEFTGYQQFFRKMGCPNEQSPELLINVQRMIREKYETGGKTVNDAKADLRLVINILNHLKDREEHELEGILIPIKQDDDTKVVLFPVSECNYCRDEDELYGDEKHFVHQDITFDTAEKLGVPTVTDTLLEDAERLEEWGQQEPLTRRIKNLLESYKDGLSVPKEIIQNADDAGATKVCFMYDERDKEGYGRKLIDKNMLECQGPALWAFNDAEFSEEDLKNITKVSGATKQEDLSKIGKFGLGFCSVYNLTDVPSFVTGKSMVIFDPHYSNLGDALKHSKQPGLKVDFTKNRKILERKTSQFEPFNGVFGCDLRTNRSNVCFDGTLFRLPLRTRIQAASSEISNVTYDKEQINSLMKIFTEAGGNLLLFTQNVSCIEFYYLPRHETNPANAALLYSVRRETIKCIERPIPHNETMDRFLILKELAKTMINVKNGQGCLPETKLTLILKILVFAEKCLSEFHINDEALSSSTNWMVAWASGTDESNTMAIQSNRKGVVPIASVACPLEKTTDDVYKTISLKSLPLGYYRTSHVFCFLPLPVEVDLPVFINGSFAVTSDRRMLSCKTTDDKDSFESIWNEVLLTDAVRNAYMLFLHGLNELNVDPGEPYYKMWPTNCSSNWSLGNFKTAFYRSVTSSKSNECIFRQSSKRCAFNKCRFLDTSILQQSFGQEAFKACVEHLENDTTMMIQLPTNIKNCFTEAGCNKAIDDRTLFPIDFYKSLVFPYLQNDVWSNDTFDSLMIHALEMKTAAMEQLIKVNECIPTCPNRLLRRPDELVARDSALTNLFSVEDERFLLLDQHTYGKSSIISTLCHLGMNKETLPKELLFDRAKSIQCLAEICSKCALDRCTLLIDYLKNNMKKIEQDPSVFHHLQSIKCLPVKMKPEHWKWQWGGDNVEKSSQSLDARYTCEKSDHQHDETVKFECPPSVFKSTLSDVVCVLKPILDIVRMDTEVSKRLGIVSEACPSLIFENLSVLCKSAHGTKKTPDELSILKKTLEAMYTHINKYFKKLLNNDRRKQEIIEIATCYIDQDILLLNSELVKPSQVVVYCQEDCSPHFYHLRSAEHIRSLDGFLELLQIEQRCSTSRLKLAMKQYEGITLDDGQTKLYVRLLQVLVDTLKKGDDKTKELDGVLIPDNNGVLRSIKAICFDEPNVNSSIEMHFTHDSISPDIAMALGVSTKREQKVKLSSRDLDLDLHSKDFGQHEELTSRLQRILSGYPCDGGILKELVQNADDAQATEIHIVVDFNYHRTDKIFNESWKPLQGPALLVCNDKPFTKEDLKGIQCLGVGSKSEDSTKTGQYGVGFNAVYHLTDVPSFLTRGEDIEGGECLCVLDPHCAYVPNTSPESPGRMFFADLKEDYPDVFSCYHPDQLMKDKGTIFRLPLRSLSFSVKSKISPKEVTEESVEKLVDDFKAELMEVMLFVNNVRRVKISKLSQGTLKELYSVNLKNETSLDEYKNKVRQCSVALRQNEDLRNFQPYEVSYKATVTDSYGTCNEWLLVRRVGFSGRLECPDIIVEAYRKKDLGLLPRGGVAFSLSESSTAHTKESKKLFCFLPLPLETGLPVHCNGHFALDHEARRNLWTDENEGYRSTWNNIVFVDIIAPAYVSALLQLKEHLDLNKGTYESAAIVQNAVSRFFNFFPNVQNARTDYFKNLIKSIYERISQDEIILFPSLRFVGDSETGLAFYALEESNMTFPPVFNTIQPMSMLTSVDTGLFKTVTTVGKTFKETIEKLTKYVVDGQTRHGLAKSKEESAKSLVSLLQELGLKIIECPGFIIKGLEEAKIEIRKTSPGLVITFLKSFNLDLMNKCCLQYVDVPVSETVFKSSVNVANCLNYCMKEEKPCIDGVPLCLTEDGVLRTFRKESPVYWTDHFRLLEEAPHLFLHHDLINLFTSVTDGIMDFTIDDFTTHLGESLQVERYKTHNSPVQWNPSGEGKPNLTWIHKVWGFLNRSVEKILSEKQTEDKLSVIDQALTSVMPWCLIPGRKLKLPNTDRSYEDVLFPVAHLKYILNLSDFRGTLQLALKNLLLPIIDGEDKFQKSTTIQHFVVSRESSIQSFLELLYYYRNDIQIQNSDAKQCRVILAHISGHLSAITENANSEHFLEMIKELPIHVTVNGGHTCLRSASKFLVLDNIITDKICTSGLEEWASQSSTILIESNDATKALYVTLGYTMEELEAIDIYITHLLPKFDCLPRSAYNDHLCWIRDILLARSANSQFNKKQERLIEMLAHVRYVPDVHGTFRKASVFLSPFNELFKQFYSDDHFPCESFCKSEWRSMLELSGIRQTATQDQFLEFARQIERSSSINEDDKVKVNMLLRHIFFCKHLGNDFLVELSKIKFIIPIIVANWKREIFAQSHTNLVCYSGSVMMQDADFVWTTCSILPKSAEPDYHYYAYRNDNEWQNIRKQLGLCSTPPIEKVVQHIQNVCDALKLMADDRNLDAEYVYRLKDLMKKIYKWMHGHTKHLFRFRDHLAPKPIVFLPEPRLFVTCDKCVRNLDRTEREIKPYLMQIPDEYGEYLDVFKWLGMDQDTSISTYVRVLMNLKMDVGNSELHVNEEKHVKLAVQRLFNLLRIGNKHDLDALVKLNLNKLFLLTRNSTLEDASLTVYSDNIDYEEKIGHDIGMSYLMDFRKMEVTIPGIVSDTLKKLPRGMQPQILSEMITKELDEHNLSLVKHGKGVDVETFINSHYFIEAIARIYVHSHKKTSSGSTTNVLLESDVEMLVAGVKRLTVVQVEQITLRLLFKNKLVGLSEKPCHFVQPSENEFVLYCVIDDENVIGWLIDNQTKFSDALKACTQGRFTDPYNHLSKILTRIYKPEDISRALDADDVKQYNVGHSSNESIFPTPGTVVHPNRHCYLFSSFYDYEPEEYVALLICEESSINDKYIPAEYIYAIVEKKIGTNVQTPFIGNALTEYELCVGGGKTERKKAYDLFKFKRNGQQRSCELVVFIDISESKDDDRDLNEILKEVRDQIKAAWTLPEDERRKIIKRLFKKWHPDKNLGKEELATEVFKFIKIYVLKMERGENIDETPDSRTSDTRYAESFFERAGPHSTFWSHFDNWEHETRNDTEHSHENDRGDGTSYMRGNRRQTSYDKVPSFHEANQWMRQAKLDFTAAQEFLPQACTGPHFNWVCFMLLKCVEKTLKALHLSIDCNNAMNTTDLLKLVKGLDQNVQTMVRSLVSVVGPCNNAMYPERLQLPKIPADMYTRDMAERARDISKNILDFADDTLSV